MRKPASDKKQTAGKTTPLPQTAGKKSGRKLPWTLLAFGVLGLAILLLYGRTCKFGITDLDDDNLIHIFSSRHYSIADAFHTNAFMQPRGGDFYRPLQSISFIVDAARSGTDPSAYHLTNIMLHWMAVCSLLCLLLLLGVDKQLSFILALLYAVHPLFVQAVAWIPGRGDLLLCLFGLLAFLTLVLFHRSGNPWLLPVHAAAFLCATLAKESGIMLPVLFAVYLLISHRQKKMKPEFFSLVPIWVLIGAAYLWLHHAAMAGLPSAGRFGIAPLASNLRTLPEMLRYFALPFTIPVMPGFSSSATIVGLLVTAALLFALGIQGKLRLRMVILGALWYVLPSIPGMMYQHEFGSHAYDFLNHRSYLPMVGIILMLAVIVPVHWYSAGNRKKRFAFVSAAVAAVLGMLSWYQCSYFADPKAFFDQAVRTNPNSALALNNRSTLKIEQGDITGALQDCKTAIRLFPGYAEAHLNAGNARFMLGDAKGALADYSCAIELKHHNVNAYDNRARAKDQLGDTAGVIADLTQAIAIDPSAPDRYFHRGRFEQAIGDTAGAMHDFSKAIEIEPGFAEAYARRGTILRSRGDYAGADADLRRAEMLDPGLAGGESPSGSTVNGPVPR